MDHIDANKESGNQSEVEEDGADIFSAIPLAADFILCNATIKGNYHFSHHLQWY